MKAEFHITGMHCDSCASLIKETLEEPELDMFAVELSLDGTQAFHDAFRVADGAFAKAMATYDALAELQKKWFGYEMEIPDSGYLPEGGI